MGRGKNQYVFVGIVFLLLWINLAHAVEVKLTASDGTASDYFGGSVCIDGDYAIVGAENDALGSAYIFNRDGVSWSEQAKLTPSDGDFGDLFGTSVSISGDYAIVGAYSNDANGTDSGAAYIFKRDGESWSEQAKLVASDGASGDWFGKSVSINGDYAIVGAPLRSSGRGAAYIFNRNGSSWDEQAKVTASNGAVNDYFGNSVSISGDCAIVGAYLDDLGVADVDDGSAYIFKRNGTTWSEEEWLRAYDCSPGDNFGISVSISGDYAIVGARCDDDNGDNSGSAYIFVHYDSFWSHQAKLTALHGSANDYFGYSVSISDDYTIIGAPGDNDNGNDSGSAYIFKRDWTIWSEQAKLVASDGASGDIFGRSVSISGDKAIVGAFGDDDNGNFSGSAYVYIKCDIFGTKWHDSDGDGVHDDDEEAIEDWRIYIDVNENGQYDAGEPSDVTDANGGYVLNVPAGSYTVAEENRPCWEQTYPGGDETYNIAVKNFQIIGGRSFGNARSIEIHPSGWGQQERDKLVASDGAAGDEFGYSVSVNGDKAIVGARWDDDNGSNSGAAYVFESNDVSCSEWDETTKLTASDGADGDIFGRSVSISGDYAIVGADGDDDNGEDSGSAYIFKRDKTSWSEQAKLVASDGADGDGFGESVSISNNYAIIGAPGDDDNGSSSGSAYIFKRDGETWSEQAKLAAYDGAANDSFSSSVSISGDYAIVGAPSEASGIGAVYIFNLNGLSWDKQAKLTASDGAADDQFGYSVSIKGDYAIVGAERDDDNGGDSGAAYIFRREDGTWSEHAKLTASDGAAADFFGCSVSISGDYAVVGAIGDDNNGDESGSAYLFGRDGAIWNEQAKLTALDGASGDIFGRSVSISGDYAIIGAVYDDDNGSGSGSIYVFGKVLCPASDLNNDCFIDLKDLGVLAGEWLQAGQAP